MPLVYSLVGSAAMLAVRFGTLVVVGVVLLGLLTVYGLYWLIFKMGND